jgi:hypothetical protein
MAYNKSELEPGHRKDVCDVIIRMSEYPSVWVALAGAGGWLLTGEASMSKSLYYMIKLLIGERGSRIRQGFSPTYSPSNCNLKPYPSAHRGNSPPCGLPNEWVYIAGYARVTLST